MAPKGSRVIAADDHRELVGAEGLGREGADALVHLLTEGLDLGDRRCVLLRGAPLLDQRCGERPGRAAPRLDLRRDRRHPDARLVGPAEEEVEEVDLAARLEHGRGPSGGPGPERGGRLEGHAHDVHEGVLGSVGRPKRPLSGAEAPPGSKSMPAFCPGDGDGPRIRQPRRKGAARRPMDPWRESIPGFLRTPANAPPAAR